MSTAIQGADGDGIVRPFATRQDLIRRNPGFETARCTKARAGDKPSNCVHQRYLYRQTDCTELCALAMTRVTWRGGSSFMAKRHQRIDSARSNGRNDYGGRADGQHDGRANTQYRRVDWRDAGHFLR